MFLRLLVEEMVELAALAAFLAMILMWASAFGG